MTIEAQVQRQIDEIMCWFDFNKVHRMMVATNWKWSGEGVPTEGRLREHAVKDLRRVGEKLCQGHGSYTISCGGFHVEGMIIDADDEEYEQRVQMRLIFGIEGFSEGGFDL